MRQIRSFINGEFANGVRNFNKRSPATGEVIAQVHEAGRAEVDASVAAARAALKGTWGRMTVVVSSVYSVASDGPAM